MQPDAVPMRTNPLDRFQHSNYCIEDLGRGAEANVYVSIPKHIADLFIAEYRSNILSLQDACELLRGALRAAKIKRPTLVHNFRVEKEALRDLRRRSHVITLIEADEEPSGWMALELLSGPTLATFVRKTGYASVAPPMSFGWHLIHQFCSAFLDLHFGIVNGVVLPGAAKYVHRDVHDENLMFRAPVTANDYPDLVFIDLGQADKIDEQDAGRRDELFKDQYDEVIIAVRDFEVWNLNIFTGDARAALDRLLHSSCYPVKDEDVANGNEKLRRLLEEVRDESSHKRSSLFRPLDEETLSNLRVEVISDRDLIRFINLASPPSPPPREEEGFVIV